MTRNAKALGLVVLAGLAACAVAAPSASSQWTGQTFTAQKYPATIVGHEEKGMTTIRTEAGTLECESTVHGQLTEPSRTLTLVPSYSNCSFRAGGVVFAANVETDGCEYIFHLETKVGVHSYIAVMDIACPSNKAITVTFANCKFQIDPQGELGIVDFENMTNGAPPDITMGDTVKEVKYTVTQDGLICPFNGPGQRNNGEFISHAPMTLIGLGGNPIDIG